MKDVDGKVAVVTGAASGIGKGMAESFVAAGMKVVLSDVEARALQQTTEALRSNGADVHAVVTDVSKPAEVESLAKETLSRYGSVHVLCNNAGIGIGARPSWNATLDDWNWIIGVNLMGVIYGVRTFLPIMIEQDTEGHIVNTASLAGLISGESTLYSVTKFGVVALSEGVYLELVRENKKPRVSVLCPGYVNTNILDSGRNRPKDKPDASQIPDDPMTKAFMEWFSEQLEHGLDPREVGDQTLQAIRDERFYILTHPTWNYMIEHRLKTLLAGENPSVSPPPGAETLMQRLMDMHSSKE